MMAPLHVVEHQVLVSDHRPSPVCGSSGFQRTVPPVPAAPGRPYRIDREYTQPLDVEALVRGAHMSAGHLSPEFRLAYGELPYG
jgi:AraC-like DNA-binding protein